MGYNFGLDTALRNRLTGAVILVLLAVLLLPELLTGSGRQPAPAPVVKDDDGPPRQTYQIDLTDAAKVPVGTAPARSVDVAPAPPVETPPAADAPVELPVPVVATPPPAVTPPPAAATTPAAKQPPATPPPSVAQTPKPAVTTPAAPPAAATKPVTPPPAASGGAGYFVQVGTFGTRERAEVLRKDLTRRGFQVTINETARDTKSFFRVRVGPVADRKAAEALEVRLRPLAPDRAIVAVP